MEELNLRIKHKVAGSFRQGQVVPVSAIRGGYPTADKMVARGVAEWVTDPANGSFPASPTAVAEMNDDTLAEENSQLRRLLAAVQAERDEASAKLHTVADGSLAEVEHLRAELAAVTGERDSLAQQVEALEAMASESKTTRKK